MKLETFESSIQKELKLLRVILVYTFLGFSFLMGLVLYSKNNYFFDKGEVFKERPMASFVCNTAFMSIINKAPISKLITDEILVALKKNEFNVAAEDILLLQVIEEGKCRIIVRGDNKVRSFLINLVSKKQNPFFYKLSEINEDELTNLEEEKISREAK
ncbi:MAG: hypothetical protein HOP07_05605 [Bacteriovoracaceae bacterium]|nr:hypothetical protein [Bacteriovoracaceae bacterium]